MSKYLLNAASVGIDLQSLVHDKEAEIHPVVSCVMQDNSLQLYANIRRNVCYMIFVDTETLTATLRLFNSSERVSEIGHQNFEIVKEQLAAHLKKVEKAGQLV